MLNISRRAFMRSAVACGIGAGFAGCMSGRQDGGNKETRYIAAYDTESGGCLAACQKIVEVHRRFDMPATFFIVGKTLEANPKEYHALLDDPLFEIASHTYSHRMLRNNDFCGAAVSKEQKREEIFKGKEAIERVFERRCVGLRPGCGFDNGFQGDPEVLGLLREAGIEYVSSLLWGPDYTMPSLLRDVFNYEDDGFGDIWELPGHGWHENLLKDNNKWGAKRLTLWPSAFPEAVPADFCKTPVDEFEVNRVFLDRAAETEQSFVSLIWHPWSLKNFDADMKMLELTFGHVRRLGLKSCTYAELCEHVSG